MLSIHQILNNIFLATVCPGVLVALWLIGLISLGTLKFCLLISFMVFIVLPIIFKYSKSLQSGLLFLTFVNFPKNYTFDNVEKFGLHGSRNLFITYQDLDDENEEYDNALSVQDNKNSITNLLAENNNHPRNGRKSLSTDKTVNIGVWHILPNFIVKQFATEFNITKDMLNEYTDTVISDDDKQSFVKHVKTLKERYPNIEEAQREFFEDMLRISTAPIIIYLHGNVGSRAQQHRVDLYKILRNMGCHVIAFDYRSYGDSTKIPPSELGVVRDSIAVYNYVRSIAKSTDIFIWGHSLGSGVSTHMLSLLNTHLTNPTDNQLLSNGPRALVLESPFNNVHDEIREHPFAKLFKNLPWFEYTIAQPMHRNGLRFESDQHIAEFRQPVLILHAEDDMVVPFHLGYKLYRSALDKRGRSWGPIEFHRFDGTKNYGHKYICRSPQLPDILRQFFITYRKEVY